MLFTACLARPTAQQLAAADPGPYPENYGHLIREAFKPLLFDPFSAQYEFGTPEKGWTNRGGQIRYGWYFPGQVNAKNRFGGYVGYKPFGAVIRDGQVIWYNISQ
jgi:hypothetical protein